MNGIAQQSLTRYRFDRSSQQVSSNGDPAVSWLTEYTYYLRTTEVRDIESLPSEHVRDIVNLARVNDVSSLNEFFAAINRKLPLGGLYTGCLQTSAQLKQQILRKYPRWLAWPYYVVFFIVKRVLPKLKSTQKLYLRFSKQRNRVLSETEVLGRLVYCGFDIVDYREVGEEMYYTVRRAGPPRGSNGSSYGPVFRMQRIGQGGNPMFVYKLRTMHPYAEYLQGYVYAKNQLKPNGKFNDDFRVATWGRFMRETWIDELPMVLNWLRGDLKLVGVRPLSEHYLSLYPVELLERRLRCKPGLLPPFYADLPDGFDAILASENRYLEAYEAHPYTTDLKYFSRILFTILVKRARSQ